MPVLSEASDDVILEGWLEKKFYFETVNHIIYISIPGNSKPKKNPKQKLVV